jgi:hypothetical protein
MRIIAAIAGTARILKPGWMRVDDVALISKDFLSGLLFAEFGFWGLALSWGFRVGTASRMGPGYFPQMLSWGILGLGVILMVRALLSSRPDTVTSGRWRPFLLIVASVVLFGLLAERAGMVISLLAMLAVGGAACLDSRWREVAISAVLLTAFAVGVFKFGLELPIPLWPRI